MPLYGNLFQSAFGSNAINLLSDTIKVMLTTSSYTPDQDTHQFKSSVTNEVSGTGYTAGGASLTSKTFTYTGASNTNTFDAADTTWSSATITARYAVIYKSTDRKSTRLNSSHVSESRMPSSA